MTRLLARDPFFQDLLDFRRDFEQIFNRFFNLPWLQEPIPHMATFVPPVEAFLDNKTKKYHLRMALPGIDPADLKLNVQGNVLTLSGERKLMQEMKELDYLHREIHYGNFERTLTLPEGLETDKIVADYKNGVLEVSVPFTAAALPRRIEIKGLPEIKRVAA
jgi:HSP20 family protein